MKFIVNDFGSVSSTMKERQMEREREKETGREGGGEGKEGKSHSIGFC